MTAGLDPSFNLLDESWIPVITAEGQFEEIGLRDLFGRSGELRGIWSDNGLETIALHRLAIAVALAALTEPETIGGPRRDLSARAIAEIDECGMPTDRIVDYLERLRDRFWLFGPEAFWQLGATGTSPVARLDPLRAVRSQPAFFDHHQDAVATPLGNAAAARSLAAGQLFAVGVGNVPGGRAFRNGLVGKLALIAIPFAETVRGTIAANLVTYDAARQPNDAPVWERPRSLRAQRIDTGKHVPMGLLDTLTWESRSVELRPGPNGAVAWMGFAMGVNAAPFEELVSRRRTDPWVPVRAVAAGGLQTLRGRVGPGAWRDSLAVVLGLLPREELAEARTVLSAARTRAAGRHALALLVGGLVAERKNTLAGALLARLPLPPEALDEMPGPFLAGLEQLTRDASVAATAARKALGTFAHEYHTTAARRSWALGGDMWQREESAYWSASGRSFSSHVTRLAGGEEPRAIRASWLSIVCAAATTAARRATEPFTDGPGLRAGALASSRLRRELPRLEKEEAT
jgi:CRISPR system Cascade subunit CasA